MKIFVFIAAFFIVWNTAIKDVHASLTTLDWSMGSGDGWITRDSQSQLDWLDVPLTVNQTFDQVRSGVWYQQGFRHATGGELTALFVNAGTPDDGFDISITYPNETRALVQLLGATLVTPDGESTRGFSGTDYFGNTITLVSHPIGVPFNTLVGKIDYIDLSFAGLFPIGEAHFTGDHPFSDEAYPFYGSFLVRAVPLQTVPEPSTLLLFGPSLVVLLSYGWWRRKTRVACNTTKQ